MIQPDSTLRRLEDFSRVYRRGRKLVGDGLIFYCFFKGKTASRRWAVVVSKKVSPKAVARNLCRRRLKAAARKFDWPAWGYDLVIVVKKEAVNQSEIFFKKDLQAGLLKIFK